MIDSNTCEHVFNIMPSAMLIVDLNVRVLKCNQAAANLLNMEINDIVGHRGGTVLHCINSNVIGGCGCGDDCNSCTIRNSVKYSFMDNLETLQDPAKLILYVKEKLTHVNALITCLKIDDTKSLLLIENITELNKLKSMIPICATCKSVRDDENYWKSVEEYITDNTGVNMTHGICPTCMKKEYPELMLDDEKY